MQEFEALLRRATARIASRYMQLPIAGSAHPVYRERVYCYELYHQLRREWPENAHYTLGGEVDKKGHPLIRGHGLNNLKPDLLVHVPGNMGGNYLVLEVKPITGASSGYKKDLRTMAAFLSHAEYERAMLLVYGTGKINAVEKRFQNFCADLGEDTAAAMELWWHATAETEAIRLR